MVTKTPYRTDMFPRFLMKTHTACSIEYELPVLLALLQRKANGLLPRHGC
jgi:hypothetical protein